MADFDRVAISVGAEGCARTGIFSSSELAEEEPLWLL